MGVHAILTIGVVREGFVGRVELELSLNIWIRVS